MKYASGIFLALLLAAPAHADLPPGSSSFDVAPTTLDLKAGEAGLFYVTNHGDEAVTIQIEALDWSQRNGAETLEPSQNLFTSPPLAHISPGMRQSVRVLARPAGGKSETAYRLRVSELPDPQDKSSGVKVLLQFSVPVFVGHDAGASPDLVWSATPSADGVQITARNQGRDTVKLTGLALNGVSLNGGAFAYILPGATRSFQTALPGGPLHLTGRDGRSGRDLALDLTAHS